MRARESSSGLWLRGVCLAGLGTCSGRSLGAGPSVGSGEDVRRDAREGERACVCMESTARDVFWDECGRKWVNLESFWMCLDLDEALPYIYVDHWIGIPCSHGVVSLNTAVCLIKKPVSLPLAVRSLSHKPLKPEAILP